MNESSQPGTIMNAHTQEQIPLILPVEDGRSAARALPLDLQLSVEPFETATFGLG